MGPPLRFATFPPLLRLLRLLLLRTHTHTHTRTSSAIIIHPTDGGEAEQQTVRAATALLRLIIATHLHLPHTLIHSLEWPAFCRARRRAGTHVTLFTPCNVSSLFALLARRERKKTPARGRDSDLIPNIHMDKATS